MPNLNLYMNLSVSEPNKSDIYKIVDYFTHSETTFLKGMGADKSKLPDRNQWIQKLQIERKKIYSQKSNYYIIWLLNNQAIGHSNANSIRFGESATMHLHIWHNKTRKTGLGMEFLHLTIPFYYENLNLKKLICEPYSKNRAPNKTLKKFGFEFVRTYPTTTGPINFPQTINRYELTQEQFHIIKKEAAFRKKNHDK